MKYKPVKSDDPYDPARPYYIEGSDYEDFNQLEAATVAAILNDGDSRDWDTISQDYRWLMVEAIQAKTYAPAKLAASQVALIEMIAMGNRANWETQTQEYVDAINGLRAAIAEARGESGNA